MRARLGDLQAGPAGLAIEVHHELEDGDPIDFAGTVAQWFLDCPGQSPAWRHYRLGVVHLRPIPGGRPPVVNVPGATHEVLLYACDPSAYPRPDDPGTWRALHPLNVVEQVELPGDEAARDLLRRAAGGVVVGLLPAEPPLAGAVEPWRTTLIRTSAHMRGEAHAP